MAVKNIDPNLIIKALEEKAVRGQCEGCGNTQFTTLHQLLHTPLHQIDGYSMPPPVVPMVGVVCNKCGNFRFFLPHVLFGSDWEVKLGLKSN